MNNPFPTAESFLSQLRDVHVGSSNYDKKPILPDHLLEVICKPIVALYDLEFLKLYAHRHSDVKLANPRQALEIFLTVNYRAINAFRDALPDSAFEPEQQSLLTETKVLDLHEAHQAFSSLVYAHLSEMRAVGLAYQEGMYPEHYHDFDEPEPRFYDDEPRDPEDKLRWRNDRRYFQEHELADWKNRKQEYEKRQKSLRRDYSDDERIFFGTPHYNFWAGFHRHHFYKRPFILPDEFRFAHEFVRATTRSGKTNYLSCKILDDLERVKRGEVSIIAMESHSVLVPKLAKLKLFASGGELEGKLIHLQPLRQDLSLNIFDRGNNDDLDIDQQSAFYRDTLRTVQFFINSIVKTDTSSQQDIVLKLLMQAVLALPNPTLADIEALLEPKGIEVYRDKFIDIDLFVLNAIERQLHTDFKTSTVAMRNRVTGIKTDPLFRRMFAHKENRLDLFRELKTSKVILVDTAGLGDATQSFGRFFLAKLYEASLKRRLLAERDPNIVKPPIFLYVDEAHDYISDEPLVAKMIDTVGKDGLAMTFATQRERQMVPDVLDALTRVYTQSVPRKPLVHIVLDPTEPPEPPRQPLNIHVQLIDWSQFPQMTEDEQRLINRQMVDRFGPIKVEMYSAAKPEQAPQAPQQEAPKAAPKPASPVNDASSNVKPDAPSW